MYIFYNNINSTIIFINLQNIYFIDYVLETKNYFLLFMPLTHEYIYINNNPVGFISKLVNTIIISVYIKPIYRNKKILSKYFQNTNNGYIVTNNNKIINYLKNHNFKNIINIPFINLWRYGI